MTYLVDLLYPLAYKIYQNRDKFKKSVAMTIEYLTSRSTLKRLGDKYNMSVGKMHKETDYVINVFATHFHDMMVTWPLFSERSAIANRFWNQRRLPLCVGAIDGTLARCYGYYTNREEMITRKCHYGFNLVFFCDDQGKVRKAFYGEAGSEADSSIIMRSTWYSSINSHLFNKNNPNRPFYILSDKGMTGMNGIVTPLSDINMPQSNKRDLFNGKIQEARAIVERVNGVLKSQANKKQF